MKCALCGAEWKTEVELGGQRHAERRCPLNGIALYQPQVEARTDTRKKERCKYYHGAPAGGHGINCGKFAFFVNIAMCPCAEWTKA